jgi:biotin-dependent carboxylase-like uncharacterized protein
MDRTAARLANLFVGNAIDAGCLESTFDRLSVRFDVDCVVAVTGSVAGLECSDPRARPASPWAFRVRSGHSLLLRLGGGMRSYLAVRGGLRSAQGRQLGSFSTDLLSGLGPPALVAGTALFVADEATGAVADPAAARDNSPHVPVVLPVLLGPREDELSPAGLRSLLSSTFTVTSESNRVGLRLAGPLLERRTDGELPSEGLVTGAVQVPPRGQPVVFGPDHPTTGGYPVVAVVRDRALDQLAQLRPDALVRFSRG